MRIPQSKLQRIKAAVHGFQLLLIFMAGCLTLAVMTKNGGFGGQTGFYFALCFFTIPAIIYQVIVPMWSRAWRLSNVWAYAVVDVLFALLWLAAAIAVAVWNANGIAKGKSSSDKDNKESNDDSSTTTTKFLFSRADGDTDGTCNSFAYGSAVKCSVSKATVGFGIIIFLLFAVTASISIHAIRQYKLTGTLPNANFRERKQGGGGADAEDGGKDVWSTNADELNNSNDRLPYGQGAEDDQEGLLGAGHRRSGSGPLRHGSASGFGNTAPNDTFGDLGSQEHMGTDADGFVHPGRRTSYHSPTEQTATVPANYADDYAPSALSPPAYSTSPNGRLQFPDANYNALR